MQTLTKTLKKPNWIVKLAAGNMLTMGVIGAAGGHNNDWKQIQKQRFERGQMYQTAVSVGLFAAGNWAFRLSPAIVAALMTSNLCFVMPLYYMAFTEKHTFRKVMPLGGGSLIVGFALMLI